MVKAYRIQEKASGVGFDWDNAGQVWDKVIEEMNELKEAVENTHESINKEDELGDLLFAIINYSRFIDVNPEDALERTNRKFIERFQYLEEKVKKSNKPLNEMTLDEMEVFWTEAKKLNKP
jgi:XTP/dITP diphosphohydrolase